MIITKITSSWYHATLVPIKTLEQGVKYVQGYP